MSPRFAVAKDADAWCNRCNMSLAHVVISMKGDKPHRLECKTCGGVHAYRTGPPGSGARSSGSRTRKPKTPKKTSYEEAMEGKSTANARNYRITEKFAVGEVISHSKFGMGVVTRLVDIQSFEAVFYDSTRTLIHGREPRK